jgi:hypothetical protein
MTPGLLAWSPELAPRSALLVPIWLEPVCVACVWERCLIKQQNRRVCRALDESDELEPATSGVTSRVGHNDA